MITVVKTDEGAAIYEGELPALVGSEKQVKWAEDIRRQALDRIHTWAHDALRTPITQYFTDGSTMETPRPTGSGPKLPADKHEQFWGFVVAATAQLVRQTSAKWWIENRGNGAQAWLRAWWGK